MESMLGSVVPLAMFFGGQFLGIFESFDNFWYFFFWQFLPIFDNRYSFDNFWQFLPFLQFWKIEDNWGQFLRIFEIFNNFDNWDNWDNFGQLKIQSWRLLRHCLQFWQLRTWIHDNHCYLTINCDTGFNQNSERRCPKEVFKGPQFLPPRSRVLSWHSWLNPSNKVPVCTEPTTIAGVVMGFVWMYIFSLHVNVQGGFFNWPPR